MDRSSYIGVHTGNAAPDKIGARKDFDRRYAQYSHAALKELSPGGLGGRALSLGCGLGFDVQELLRLGYDAYGFEVTDMSAAWKEHLGADATRCTVDPDGALPYGDASFDLITCVNVLEHVATIPPEEFVTEDTLPERQYFVRQAIQKLRPGGLLILTYPNRAYPFDWGHQHHYIPGGVDHYLAHGYTHTNPWHPDNFIPSMHEVVAACDGLNVSVGFLADDYLFGPNGPDREDPLYEEAVRKATVAWSRTTGEPLSHARRPHAQAFIANGPIRVPVCGAWSVEWLVEGELWAGNLMRQALLDKWLLCLSNAEGRREGWECKFAAPGIVSSSDGAMFNLDALEAQAPIGTMSIRRDEEAFWLALAADEQDRRECTTGNSSSTSNSRLAIRG